ncbi:hypothetical protein H0H92_000550 [Tricholoma furcatifolium]|nr:hypothetical protein H0H92_000550 [Tricholoma furcatifolium]
MEGTEPSSLKHSRQDDSMLEGPSKRLKPVDSVDQDALSSPTGDLPDATEGKNLSGSEPTKPLTKGSKSKDKRGQYSRKERRRRGTRNEETNADAAAPSDVPKAPRLPKRQSALLIGFCGSGYSGMQIQPDHSKTIEGVLFQALVRAGAVSQDNADDPVKIGLARAARTDAGVHAAGNVVSLKMITSIPDVPDVVARVNEELPPEIRLWGFTRVQNSFNARLICDSRKYTYFFPTYLLIPPRPGSGLDRSLEQYTATLSPDPTTGEHTKLTHPFWENIDLSTFEGELSRKRAWRVSPEQVERLRAAAKRFEGTHNFHNFTVARDFGDRSNQRHMKKIEVADPVVYGDTEWISVLFHGQSFMLHQRKMMSALVLSCRTETPEQIIDEVSE